MFSKKQKKSSRKFIGERTLRKQNILWCEMMGRNAFEKSVQKLHSSFLTALFKKK